jgi:RNA polymerase sigma factor (sigma-70 family)
LEISVLGLEFQQNIFVKGLTNMKLNNYILLSDEAIIELIVKEKKINLYSLIYKRYYHKVLDKCYSLLKSKEQAEEFAKEILSKSFEKLSGFKGKSSFSSWLYSISYNHCIDYLRLKKKMHYPNWSSENELPEIIDESDEDFTEITYDNLSLILEQIHPEEKALLLMKYIDNLSISQIGKSLRISNDAAKMRLKRARTRVIYLYKQKFFN